MSHAMLLEDGLAPPPMNEHEPDAPADVVMPEEYVTRIVDDENGLLVVRIFQAVEPGGVERGDAESAA